MENIKNYEFLDLGSIPNNPTRVVHCNYEKYDIYIGRGSYWGNPFEIGKDGTRFEVIEKYKNWIIDQEDLLNRLHELRGKTLGCWCKTPKNPKACHGDILVELILNLCGCSEIGYHVGLRNRR